MSDVVLLVGGGTGDPELLTLKAEAALRAARTVVADFEVGAMATAVSPHAEVVEVADAGAALIEIRAGRAPVVRLYVGDPWLHPDHHAERAALVDAGISCESIPGVSVEIGTATAAGRPLHHRLRTVVATLGAPVRDG